MASKILKISALAFLASASVLTAAQAGGFGRGSADTEILYEDGNFNIRAGATYVSPTRKYSVNPNPALVGTDYADSYLLPSAAVKLNVTDDLRCAGTQSQPYGGSATWASPSGSSGKVYEQFTTNELGLTCAYKFDLSKGRAWVIGGLFHESFDYNLGAVGGGLAVNLGASDVGFRLGAAYEIPEIALRAQLMYRSATEYDAAGTTTRLAPLPGGGANPLNGLPLNVALPIATGHGNLPQSVELKVQSGVAPGWLVMGSVKWTDWSVFDTLDLNPTTNPLTATANQYFWKDGWTVSAGVGHAFNEKLSGAATITWDQGVKTGWDNSSDTWTLGAGASYKDDLGGEMKFGGGLTYIAASSENKYGAANTAVSSGWAWALGASYKTKW